MLPYVEKHPTMVSMKWRIQSIRILFIALFLILITRLFYIQIIKSSYFKLRALKQHNYELRLSSSRGVFKTTDGGMLVMNQPASLIYAKPKEIENFNQFADAVSGIIPKDRNELYAAITQPDIYWVSIARKIPVEGANQLKNLNLKGLGFEKESVRFYPEGSMSAQMLGFVGQDENGQDIGYFGLEGYYERELSGKDGMLIQEKDVRGDPILFGNIRRINPQDGKTLELYLDRAVQKIVENRLANGIAKYGAKEGSVIVMDPKTGGIMAMASYPSYDPGTYKNFDSNLYRNPVVASGYEPGSTFKVLVMAAGIEEGKIKPDTEMDENGPVRIGQYAIRTWDNKYRGKITMTDVIVHSSNVGMVYVGNMLGKDKLLKYMNGFGFGTPTGIDLQEESSPDLKPEDSWQEIDIATLTFGQGIAVTPIQMLRAVSSISNGGKLVTPRIVKSIKDSEDKRLVDNSDSDGFQIISPETSRIMTEMMVAAVENGEAKWAKPKGYRIAGKTGTAQIPVAGHYDDKKTIASFVGFAPSDKPKFIILVTLREPTSSPWGSETAAPLFFAIAGDLFSYYSIAPEQ